MYTKFWLENLKGINRPLGRPRHRWEDNIRQEGGREGGRKEGSCKRLENTA
jgi:hypothetical protein